MENKAVLLLVGAVFGAAVGVFVWSKAKTESSAHAARQTANVDAQNKLEDLEKQNADLTERLQDQLETINQLSEQIDELSRPSTGPDGATPTAPTEPGADLPPLTDEELEAGLKRFGEQLQSIILGHGDKAVEELVAARGIVLEVTLEGRAWLADRGYDPDYGARPLKRVIEKHLKDPLAQQLLAGRMAGPLTVRVSHDSAGDDALDFELQAAASEPEPGAE